MEIRRMKVKNWIIKTLGVWNNGEDKFDNGGKTKREVRVNQSQIIA